MLQSFTFDQDLAEIANKFLRAYKEFQAWHEARQFLRPGGNEHSINLIHEMIFCCIAMRLRGIPVEDYMFDALERMLDDLPPHHDPPTAGRLTNI